MNRPSNERSDYTTEDHFSFTKVKKEPPKGPSAFQKFIKMGKYSLMIVGAAGAFAAMGYGAHIADEKRTANQNIEIAQKEQTFAGGKITQVKDFIDSEKDKANKTFAENQILISRYSQYPDLVKLLQYGPNLSSHMKNNTLLVKDVNAKLDTDKAKIEKLELVSTRDEKVKVLLNSDSYPAFEKWSKNLSESKFMYVGSLTSLNKTIQSELETLQKTQSDIMGKVKERLKAKDFDLNKAQAHFSGVVSQEKNKELGEFANLKAQLKDTDEPNAISDNDLNEAKKQLDVLEVETTAQIKKDREAIEKLMAETTPVQVAAAEQPVQTAGSSNNFATYLLMYHWMNAGSSNATAYQAGVNSMVARNAPAYNMNSTVTSSRVQQYKAQMSSRVSSVRASPSRSGGMGRSGGFSSGG